MVPVVHEEEQRDVDRCAEATVREANAGRFNEFGRRGLVRVITRLSVVRPVVGHKKSRS